MRFWQIIGLIVALNAGVATLMILSRGKGAIDPKPLHPTSMMSTRNLEPAPNGHPYNFRYMAFCGGIMALTAGALVVFLRRNA